MRNGMFSLVLLPSSTTGIRTRTDHDLNTEQNQSHTQRYFYIWFISLTLVRVQKPQVMCKTADKGACAKQQYACVHDKTQLNFTCIVGMFVQPKLNTI